MFINNYRKIKGKDLLAYIKQHHEKARTFALYARQQQDKKQSQNALDMQNAINGVQLPGLDKNGVLIKNSYSASSSTSQDEEDNMGPSIHLNAFKLGSTRKFS